MNRKQFFDLVGEYPEDVIGNDWENEIDEWLREYQCQHCGGIIAGFGDKNNACMMCKMD